MQKINETSRSGVPRVSRAWGEAKFRRSHPARSWQHKIKESLQSNSKDKVFLLLLLKMYRLFCQKADMI